MEQAQAALAFTKLSIETDGTAKGTKIMLNGKAIENLGSISLTFFNDGLPSPLSLGFSTKDPDAEPGTLIQHSHFSLICPKGNGDGKATASLQKQPTVPIETLPRDQRRNVYAKLFNKG